MTEEEIEQQMIEDFITAWNNNYGGLGGRMTLERMSPYHNEPSQEEEENDKL